MDGFAVRFEDIKGTSRVHPVTLRVAHQTGFRNILGASLHKQEAIRISTGGYLPPNADTVVPTEYTEVDHRNRSVNIYSPFTKGSFVSHAGNEIKKKTLLLRKGHVLRCQDLALISMLGISYVTVFRKPRVTIIPTGNELTENFRDIKKGKVLNTNSRIISRLIESSGGFSLDLGITRDNIYELQTKIMLALPKSDIIITTGGSSVGVQDLVSESINRLGKPGVLVHGIKLDRGRVTGLAVLKRKPIIILPGPVQGTVNGFIVFVLPLLRSMLGLTATKNEVIVGKLVHDWHAREKFQNFLKILYVKIWKSKFGDIHAMPITGETSNISILTRTNGYIMVPEKVTLMKRGQQIKISLLPGLSFSSQSPVDFAYASR
jgi:molybdenum cofactor synthesis domain-containing protein